MFLDQVHKLLRWFPKNWLHMCVCACVYVCVCMCVCVCVHVHVDCTHKTHIYKNKQTNKQTNKLSYTMHSSHLPIAMTLSLNVVMMGLNEAEKSNRKYTSNGVLRNDRNVMLKLTDSPEDKKT